MGLGQSTVGMWKINSLINLHLLTGSIAKPGCGPFSLTGQPNAMGGREIGLLSHQLPGYRLVENAEQRGEVERYWDCEPGTISDKPGLTAVEMFRALETGRLKAIWIAATNPAVSLPDLTTSTGHCQPKLSCRRAIPRRRHVWPIRAAGRQLGRARGIAPTASGCAYGESWSNRRASARPIGRSCATCAAAGVSDSISDAGKCGEWIGSLPAGRATWPE
jgi:hypothetical protein